MNYSRVRVQFGGDLDVLDLVFLEKLVKDNTLVSFQFELVPCVCACVCTHAQFTEEI